MIVRLVVVAASYEWQELGEFLSVMLDRDVCARHQTIVGSTRIVVHDADVLQILGESHHRGINDFLKDIRHNECDHYHDDIPETEGNQRTEGHIAKYRFQFDLQPDAN